MSDMHKQPTEMIRAIQTLESGGVIGFPTETVYGLGADAENPEAVAQIYALKGRPASHPVIVHLAKEADIRHWAADIHELVFALTDAFWPGPLTLILKRAAHIPDAVSGGQETIGLRCPAHPVAQQLLQAYKHGQGGIAAPSANRFGRVSPTTAEHVREEFKDDPRLSVILDGGQSDIGIESTIIDLSRMKTHGPVLLRPGHISPQEISSVIGITPKKPDEAAPRASGTLAAHYAPQTPVLLLPSEKMVSMLKQLSDKGKMLAVMHYSTYALPEKICVLKQMPNSPETYAHDLYAALRALDSVGADVMILEQPPLTTTWESVNDRLTRAAHDSQHLAIQ